MCFLKHTSIYRSKAPKPLISLDFGLQKSLKKFQKTIDMLFTLCYYIQARVSDKGAIMPENHRNPC